MAQLDKFCQSCMMPHDKDPGKGGTNRDGSKSKKYCSFCYQKGQFTNPKIKTAKDMQDFVKNVLKQQGVPRILRWFYTMGIPKLERWQKNS
jgi:radical SAM superfamily enzyme